MKILLDESVPRLVKLRLPRLNITTVQEMGWAGLECGELLRRVEEIFDVLELGSPLRSYGVLSNQRIWREEHTVMFDGLANQHAIKRVSMQCRKLMEVKDSPFIER